MGPVLLAGAPPLCHRRTMRNVHAWVDIATIVRLTRRANILDNLKRYSGMQSTNEPATSA